MANCMTKMQMGGKVRGFKACEDCPSPAACKKAGKCKLAGKAYKKGGKVSSCGTKKYKKGGKVRGAGCATKGVTPCKVY